MPFVSTDDAKIEYKVDGDGPGLALVHGTGGDAEKVFGHVVDHFATDHRVIRPNFSGSGETVDAGGPLSVDDIADQIAAVIDEAADQPVDLLGFSLGAVAAAVVAAERPELVRRLILVGGWATSTGPRDRLYLETWLKLVRLDREVFKRFTALTGYSPPAVDGFTHEGIAAFLDDSWPPDGMERQIDLSRRVDIRDRLPRIQASTLIVGLGRDALIPVEGSRELDAEIPDSRLVEIADQGHMDWFNSPGPLLRVVDEFLA